MKPRLAWWEILACVVSTPVILLVLFIVLVLAIVSGRWPEEDLPPEF